MSAPCLQTGHLKSGVISPAEGPNGELHVVTTVPILGVDDNELLKKAISYFVMWDPYRLNPIDNTEGAWYNVSEIAGSPVGIPAQIGHSGSWTYQDSALLADGYVQFIQSVDRNGAVSFDLTSYWK